MNRLLPLFLLSLIIRTTMTGCISTTSQTPKDQPSSTPNPVSLKGKSLIGTILTASDDQGRPLTLKIAAVELDNQDRDRDLYLYTVLHQNFRSSQWQNLCQSDRKGIAKAIPLAGQWDQQGNHIDNQEITFACTNSVLAKCVLLGYKPWKTVNGQSLRPYHQACTRMLRADYCGNGKAHTQEGTPIDVYDRLQIQQPTLNSGMTFEAAWNPDGVVWLSRTRYPHTLKQLQQDCPEKLKTILHSGQSLTPGKELQLTNALLFNQSRQQ